MEHESLEVLEDGEVGEGGDGVGGQVEVLEVDVLPKVLHGLDVVVGEAEPGEQVDVLEALDGDQVVRGQVQHLEEE